MTIYPEIKIDEITLSLENEFRIKIQSVLRFLNKNDNKYYLVKFKKTGYAPEYVFERDIDKIIFRNNVINRLLFEIEFFKHNGIIDTNVVNEFNEPLFELDKNQEPESERILRIYKVS